jgi:hypothetical protein
MINHGLAATRTGDPDRVRCICIGLLREQIFDDLSVSRLGVRGQRRMVRLNREVWWDVKVVTSRTEG